MWSSENSGRPSHCSLQCGHSDTAQGLDTGTKAVALGHWLQLAPLLQLVPEWRKSLPKSQSSGPSTSNKHGLGHVPMLVRGGWESKYLVIQ